MGNSSSATSNGNRDSETLIDLPDDLVAGLQENLMASTSRMRPKLGFHAVHGEHVRISKGGKLAKRVESFCKGLAFSDRPIEVDEIICLKFTEMATNWSGVLRFGVTNTDPATLAHSLPRFACPDLTSKEGNWAKALAERYCQAGSILHFYVRDNGELYYGINGVQKGLFLSGINTRLPLYVLVDIYGNSNCLEFLDPADVPPLRRHPRLFGGANKHQSPPPPSSSVEILPATSSTANQRSVNDNAANQQRRPQDHVTPSGGSGDNNPFADRQAGLALARELSERLSLESSGAVSGHGGGNQGRMGVVLPPPGAQQGSSWVSPGSSASGSSSSRYYSGCHFESIKFSALHGKNVNLNHDRTQAHRSQVEYANGYVFTTRPIRLNEKVVVQILNTMPAYQGGLAFGMTSCDPIHLRPDQFPDDSDLLLDRAEYWVVAKDIATSPKVQEELAFHVSDEGQVFFTRNNNPARVIMHVDQTQKMWMFFDVYGTTQSIKLLGSTSVTSRPEALTSRRQSTPGSASPSSQSASSTMTSSTYTDQSALLDAIVGTGGGATLQPLRVNLPQAGATAGGQRSETPSNSQTPPGRPPLPPPRPPALARPTSVAGPSFSTPRSAGAAGIGDRKSSSAAVLQPCSTEMENECSVCMSETVNAVLYTCGHMCMCFDCALLTWEKKGDCPICRNPIKDVIKAFRT